MEDTEMRTCCREEGGKEWERELVGYKGLLRAQKSKGSRGGQYNAVSTQERKT